MTKSFLISFVWLSVESKIGDDGIQRLKKGLMNSQSLLKLMLDSCSLSSVGTKFVIDCFLSNPNSKLEFLSIGGFIFVSLWGGAEYFFLHIPGYPSSVIAVSTFGKKELFFLGWAFCLYDCSSVCSDNCVTTFICIVIKFMYILVSYFSVFSRLIRKWIERWLFFFARKIRI